MRRVILPTECTSNVSKGFNLRIYAVFLVVNKSRHGQLARQLRGRAGAGGAEINMQAPVSDSCTTHTHEKYLFQSMNAVITCLKMYT